MRPVKVLLVDDNPEFLETAAGFLAIHPGLEIAGLAQTGHAAVQMVGDLNPDLVVMDLAMPDMNGLEATRRIKALPKSPPVVMLTLYDTADYGAQAKAAGAKDFITKSEFGDLLLPLIFKMFPQLQNIPAHECA